MNMRKENVQIKFLKLPMFILFLFSSTVVGAKESESVVELKKQVESLQKRIEQLEAERNNALSKPDPYFQRRPQWDPFEEINRMQQEMDQMFQNSFDRSGGRQGIFSNQMNFDANFDLKETSDGYEIKIDMQGLDKDKVDIQINEHSITIKGEQSREDTEQGPNQYVRSQSFGSFMRTIPLPMDADTTKVKTEKEGDRLVIRMPKKNK
jgi:HSP20 family protein